MTALRPELPELPRRIRGLPVDERGYPVPWFVADVYGKPDHRVVRPGGVSIALKRRLCWVCGGVLGAHKSFVAGPMCALNRVSAEPPSHLECADWSARACPFLSRPHARRRDAGKPEDVEKPAGVALMRNPGAALVWTTRRFKVEHGLCRMGDPEHVRWYAQGRPATREEVVASIDSGLPELAKFTHGPEGEAELKRLYDEVMELVPA